MGKIALKGRKGVLIGISLFIITLTILSYATIQSNYRKDFIRESTEISAIDRANAIISGAQTSSRTIISASGGINASVSGVSAAIMDVTGNGNSGFYEQLFRYKRFFDLFTDRANITISNETEFALRIMPIDFTYSRPGGVKGQAIKLEPSNTNYSGYDIKITLPAGKSLGAACDRSITAGGKNLDILITDGSTNCQYAGTFNPASAGSMSANTTANEPIIITIPGGTYGTLYINDTSRIGLMVKTNITLPSEMHTRPSVFASNINITANLTMFNVVAVQSVQLA